MVAVLFLPESQYPGGTGKFIHKPAILDEQQLQIDLEALKVSRTVAMLQHVLLLTETKGSYAHVLLMISGLH